MDRKAWEGALGRTVLATHRGSGRGGIHPRRAGRTAWSRAVEAAWSGATQGYVYDTLARRAVERQHAGPFTTPRSYMLAIAPALPPGALDRWIAANGAPKAEIARLVVRRAVAGPRGRLPA